MHRSKLESAASPKLAAWIQQNSAAVDEAIAAAVTPARAVVMASSTAEIGPATVHDAARWMLRAARSLVQSTVIEQGVMVQDEIGASISTHNALQHYAAFNESAPIEIHYRGALAVRVHTAVQIDRRAFDAAFRILRDAWEATNAAQAPDPGPKKALPIYAKDKGAKSGLGDGTNYTWEAATAKVSLFLPLRRSGPTANELLSAAGIPRSAYAWVAAPGTTAKRWLMVDVDWTSRVANAVREHYPQLAAALDQNAPVWRAEAGRTGEVVVQAPAPVTVTEAEINANGGTVAGMTWVYRSGSPTVGFTFDRKVGLQRGEPGTWVKGNDGKTWWYAVTTARLAELEAVLAPLVPAWGVVARALAAQLRPTVSADQGETVDGRWIREGAMYKLFLAYNADMSGWQRNLPVQGKKDAQGFFWLVAATNLPKILNALARGWPKTAAALAEALNIQADPESTAAQDAVQETHAALRDLSASAGPQTVQHPLARQAVEHVVNALQKRLPHAMRPRPFQMTGVAFARLAGYRALIGDAMGLGKTVQALCALAVDPEKLLPAVVVCPAAVLYNWAKEAAAWLPTVPVQVITSGKTPLPPRGWRGICVVSWGLIASITPNVANWGPATLILDEAHYAKEMTAARSKAVRDLSQTTPHVLLLSGTPILNRVIEIYPLLNMINPVRWGSKSAFGRLYTNVQEFTVRGKTITKYEGGKNLDQLREALRPFMVRREKGDVLSDLPPKTRVQLPVVLDDSFAREYEAAESEFFAWLTKRLESKILEFLGPGNSEAARAQALHRAERALAAEELVKDGHLRRMIGRAKVPAALEQIETLLENGEPVVVFVDHQDVLHGIRDGLKKSKVPFVVIEGATNALGRSQATTAFQDGKVDVILCTQAAKEGITLTRASNVVFVEYWWVPGFVDQAEDRIHRIGQRNAATIWYPHVEGTIDDDLLALLEHKRNTIRGAVGDTVVAAVSGGSVVEAMRARREKREKRNPQRPEVQTPRSFVPTDAETKLPAAERIHVLMFARPQWTEDQARHWANASSIPVVQTQRASAVVRLTVQPASRFDAKSLRVMDLGQGIRAMVGNPR